MLLSSDYWLVPVESATVICTSAMCWGLPVFVDLASLLFSPGKNFEKKVLIKEKCCAGFYVLEKSAIFALRNRSILTLRVCFCVVWSTKLWYVCVCEVLHNNVALCIRVCHYFVCHLSVTDESNIALVSQLYPNGQLCPLMDNLVPLMVNIVP